jgi:PAS domain S-box-containing protein
VDPRDFDGDRLWLRELLDALPVPVIVYGTNGEVLLANQARKGFAGADVTTLALAIARTAPAREDGTPMQRDELPALRALRGEFVRGERLRLRAADGHTEVLLVNASPLKDSAGHIVASVVVFHDITDISDLERGRRELFSMANHDLRTPLSVILGLVQLARRALSRDPDRVAAALADIERQSRRMLRLIQDLLDVARFETGTIPVVTSPIDLRERIKTAVERQPTGSHLSVIAPNEPLVIPLDGDRIDQVLDNLLSNALRHTSPGTEVDITVNADATEAVVRVRDRGRGIEPDERARLFTPFYQTPRGRSYGGTGLGLYISRRIVEAHGGRLWLDESGPEGSVFAFALPLELEDEVV